MGHKPTLGVTLAILFMGCAGFPPKPPRQMPTTIHRPLAKMAQKDTVQEPLPTPVERDSLPSFNFVGADLRGALRTVAKTFGVRIIIPPQIRGSVTLSRQKAGLEEILDSLLGEGGYGYLQEGDLIRVVSPEERITEVFRLQNLDPEEVAEKLSQISQTCSVLPEPRSRSLIISGTYADIKRSEKILANLDHPLKEVIIKAEIMEVTINDERKLGLTGSLNWKKGNDSIDLRSPFSLGGTNLLLTYGRITDKELNLTLQAIQDQTKAQILSSPRVVTLDGQEAKILVGERVPYVKTTTETGSGAVMQEVEFQDVGIELRVTPFVAGGTIVLQVHSEVSEVLDKLVQGVPRIGTREADATVSVPDGETVVMGGLLKEGKKGMTHKIPLLGDLLPFKWLFRNEDREKLKTELIIFLTPHILTQEGMRGMSQRRDEIKRRFDVGESNLLYR